jgi:hypothetical protein
MVQGGPQMTLADGTDPQSHLLVGSDPGHHHGTDGQPSDAAYHPAAGQLYRS